MNALQRKYLARLGIPAWELRRDRTPPGGASSEPASLSAPASGVGAEPRPEPVVAAAAPAAPAGQAVPAPERDDDDGSRWDALRAEVVGCTRCALHRGRKQAVFGVGRRDTGLMVVGEAPGAEEDRRGEPFVGPAGQLLNAMLRAIGFARDDVFIANVLKCRPPGNRDPSGDEAAACSEYLERQIALVRPQALLAVGRISAQWLLKSDIPVGRLRGRIHRYGDLPLVVTYHPAYLLRTPLAKAKSWQDLCMIRSLVSGP